MRGNEILDRFGDTKPMPKFPIPMRGNELVQGRRPVRQLPLVSDPHEG